MGGGKHTGWFNIKKEDKQMLGNFAYCNPTKLYFGEDALQYLNTELPKREVILCGLLHGHSILLLQRQNPQTGWFICSVRRWMPIPMPHMA